MQQNLNVTFKKLKSITKKTVETTYDFGVKTTHRIIAKHVESKNAFYTSNCSHSDCEEFVRAKQTSGTLTKFNISVVLTDDFMRAVENDEFFDQGFNGIVYKRIKARDLYKLIMQSCYDRAEPGVLFADNMMKNNPIAYLGKVSATNPCVIDSTIIAVADGRNGVSIKQLTEEAKDVLVYSFNRETNKFEIKTGRNPRKTGENREVWKLILEDDSYLIATPDHKIPTKNRSDVSLKDLQTSDQLFSLTGIKKIKRLEFFGNEDVYNITVDDNHNYIVNTSSDDGICINNCGEVPGLASIGTVCLLGSLNLTQYVKIKEDRTTYFDFDEYCNDIKIFTRMLDNVNDLTYSPVSSYQWVIDNLRQIGMGINGLGSTLVMLGIRYDSQEAVEFSKKVCQLRENLAWQTSALLAKEKGAFGAYNKELFESTEFFKSDRISEDTKKLLRKYGARNAKVSTVPPLGNSSILSDITSNGIEPIFLLEYERKVICQVWPEGLNCENVKSVLKYFKEKDFEYWRGNYNSKEYYYEPHNRGLCEINIVRDYGYQWLLENFPNKDHSNYLVTTKELKIDDHLNIQAVVQYYNSQSVSKTCNLPNDYLFDDFQNLYMKAWKLGLNGFTTYREGSMESVLSDINKASKREIIAKDIKLPDEFINGSTHIIKREGKKFYLHFSYLPEDSNKQFPIVLWIYTNAQYEPEELKICNKAARNLSKLALDCGVEREIVKESVTKANKDYPHNRLGRMVSLCLRHNIPREDILVSLMGIDGDNISTLLTAVRKFLSQTLSDGTVLKGLKCPHCGGRVITEGGCQRCIDCSDYSACG
jgi:ribonucleotide reductase alpha subunit